MLIRDIGARWLRYPIPEADQHVSDFGRISSFDMALVHVELDNGVIGWGEAKASVGSAGGCQSLVATIRDELGPALIGEDARRINRLWDVMYNGTRFGHALDSGRALPILGRRGATVTAMSGIDMALWDALGKSYDMPVVDLWGGPRADTLPAYASGGWADATSIGGELQGYVDAGFDSVKMRVGVMDGDVDTSVERVLAARSTLGRHVGLMVDAHGTFAPTDAMRFARCVDSAGLRWFEEPVSSDDRAGTARVRASTSTPIALGESEFTRFDFRDAIEAGAVDVLQPDLAICGGPTEARRIAALAETYQLELAPHCWGSALSFAAGVSLAFASSAAKVIEYSLGANPMLRELPEQPIEVSGGRVQAPTRPGFGITPNMSFVEQYERD
ncbi:MAG: mandelate racemase/muconate lactonizing enzyme family protein [Acidimicrobiia bacterium]|nr:mandelate racemase/muconate lactonizing enzyme family protein [Acidimicrobiia bacterium]